MARATSHSFVPIAIAGNGLLTLVLGAGVLHHFGSRSRVGAWLASKTDRAKHFGPALDEMLRNDSRLPWASLGWCVLARFCQVCQYTVLLMAMGHARALIAGFCAEGVALVGTAIGEIIPAQIGAIEFNFTISAAGSGYLDKRRARSAHPDAPVASRVDGRRLARAAAVAAALRREPLAKPDSERDYSALICPLTTRPESCGRLLRSAAMAAATSGRFSIT